MRCSCAISPVGSHSMTGFNPSWRFLLRNAACRLFDCWGLLAIVVGSINGQGGKGVIRRPCRPVLDQGWASEGDEVLLVLPVPVVALAQRAPVLEWLLGLAR